MADGNHMNTQQGILAAIVIGFIGLSLPCLAGRTAMYTERSVEELKLMTNPELAKEAWLVCRDILIKLESGRRYSASGAHHKASEKTYEAISGRQYLMRIGLVIWDKQGGQMPAWFEDISRATVGGSKQDCDAAATAGGWRPKQ